jgi:hypothetical protein
MVNQELLLQIIGEWLHDTNLPSPVPRESPVISVRWEEVVFEPTFPSFPEWEKQAEEQNTF